MGTIRKEEECVDGRIKEGKTGEVKEIGKWKIRWKLPFLSPLYQSF
jgi:hypothetical protein